MNRQKLRTRTPSPHQGILKFPTAVTSTLFATQHPYESIAYRVLIISLAVCAAAYVYFVTASVLNITALKDAVRASALIQSSIGSLEEQRLALSKNIGSDTSSYSGLVPVLSSTFVYRPGNIGIARDAHERL